MKLNIPLNHKDVNNEIKQYKITYQSTIAFDKFINRKMLKSKTVMDAGCGKSGTMSFYVKKYKNVNFIGTDYKKVNILVSRTIYKKFNLNPKTEFIQLNLLNKIKNKKLSNLDGIISEKTFCVFKNIEKPLLNLIKLRPKWIAINSLFYDGNMDILTHIRSKKDFKTIDPQDSNPDGDFNIFSLPSLKNFLKKKKYKITKVQTFFPKKKITFDRRYRGTYTTKTAFNKFTCFTGPVFLPWKFVLIEKKSK